MSKLASLPAKFELLKIGLETKVDCVQEREMKNSKKRIKRCKAGAINIPAGIPSAVVLTGQWVVTQTIKRLREYFLGLGLF